MKQIVGDHQRAQHLYWQSKLVGEWMAREAWAAGHAWHDAVRRYLLL